MSTPPALTPELLALAKLSFQHQTAGRFAEAAQGYSAVLSRAPNSWPTCYNLGLVYQHLDRLPEAADMYLRAVRLNPQLAEAFNNLGNVFKALKNDVNAIEAYRRAIGLNPQLADASYNLGVLLQSRKEYAVAIELFQSAIAVNTQLSSAWDALYRGLIALNRHEEAINTFLAWDRAMPPLPELVVAGLALCRPIGDHALEARYLALALDWPFEEFTSEQFVPILGMIQYFDVTREQILACYRRYDVAVAACNPDAIPLLPRRATDSRLRIGYVSSDFRTHVMGRWMLGVIARHDRNHFAIYLISTCQPREHDEMTTQFRSHTDGFADVSELDDFAAAKSIAEVDLDLLVDLVGHTMAARPGIYAHRPARSIVTHLGYHGCLGLRAVDYKFTDHIADQADAAQFQIERLFALSGCLFPLVRVTPADVAALPIADLNLEGKFVFAAFTNVLKLSARCLNVWRRVLDVLPEAVLLFSPVSPTQQPGIERALAAAGINKSRAVFLFVPSQDALWHARYRMVHAVMDTFPYAGGDTTLAALDMGVPVVTLMGTRQSERVGASILTHLNVTETIANSEDEFVDIAVRLARDAAFMAQTRQRIETAVAATDVQGYTRSLEDAYTKIAAEKPVAESMSLTARQFFQSLRDATQRHANAKNDDERNAVATIYATLRVEQPEYSPLLRVQSELAQAMGDLALAADCASVLLRRLPDDLDVRLSSAGFLIDDGAASEALNVLPPVVDASEADVRVLKLYVRAHAKLGQWELAHRHSVAAVALAPADAQVLFWHGMVLIHTGEAETALTFLNRALVLAPDHVEAAYNAGVILAELGNTRDAETVFRRALAASPARATATVRVSAHLRLLQLLLVQGRVEEWISEGQRFVKAYPDSEQSRLIASRIARYEGNLEREMEILRPLAEAASVLKDDVAAVELIGELLTSLPYYDVPAHLLQHLRERYADATRVLYLPIEPQTSKTAQAHLQVGYLIDFSLPFVTELIAVLIRHHDRERMSLHLYAISPVEPSVREAIEATGVKLVSLATIDEHRAAKTIQADNLGILIDIAAFGHYAKPAIWSHCPARVRVALPGFTHPMGIGEVEIRLSDSVAELDSGTEPILPIPALLEGCVFPLLPNVPMPLQITRVPLGIDAAKPVFGVLAAFARISARCLTTWKTLADRVPAAVFFVCPMEAPDRELIRRLLLAAGIEAARILMLPVSQSRPRDLSLRGIVDVILDTMPGSDYFSTRAAILDAIPLVTIPGRMFEERVALSLLTALGETSTVAASGRDYIDIAAQLAFDPKLRAEKADKMRALLATSSMADSANYVARFEDALLLAATSS